MCLSFCSCLITLMCRFIWALGGNCFSQLMLYGEVRELDQSGYCQLNLSSIASIGKTTNQWALVCLCIITLICWITGGFWRKVLFTVIAIESLYLYQKENTINYKFNLFYILPLMTLSYLKFWADLSDSSQGDLH